MIELCRFCRRVGTSGDGPGAPCRPCVRRAVDVVVGRPACMQPTRRASTLRPAALTPLTFTERTLVAAALGRPRRRVSDVALLVALPVLAVELGLRSLAQRGALRVGGGTADS